MQLCRGGSFVSGNLIHEQAGLLEAEVSRDGGYGGRFPWVAVSSSKIGWVRECRTFCWVAGGGLASIGNHGSEDCQPGVGAEARVAQRRSP